MLYLSSIELMSCFTVCLLDNAIPFEQTDFPSSSSYQVQFSSFFAPFPHHFSFFSLGFHLVWICTSCECFSMYILITWSLRMFYSFFWNFGIFFYENIIHLSQFPITTQLYSSLLPSSKSMLLYYFSNIRLNLFLESLIFWVLNPE